MKRFFSVALISFCLIGLLFFNSCKTEEEIVYDIRGTWAITYTWGAASNMPAPGTMMDTFVGSLTSGTWTNNEGHNGTYSVSGMSVTFIYTSGTTYTGSFTSLTSMNGTMISWASSTGTWVATKM